MFNQLKRISLRVNNISLITNIIIKKKKKKKKREKERNDDVSKYLNDPFPSSLSE